MGGIGGVVTTSEGGHTTTVLMDDTGNENSNLEEMHYLMVHVEKLKKNMLSKIEG